MARQVRIQTYTNPDKTYVLSKDGRTIISTGFTSRAELVDYCQTLGYTIVNPQALDRMTA